MEISAVAGANSNVARRKKKATKGIDCTGRDTGRGIVDNEPRLCKSLGGSTQITFQCTVTAGP